MSYAYELADEAMREFQRLEPWLAEEFLDEMEGLVANPPQAHRNSFGGVVSEVVRDRVGKRYYVFFSLAWDHVSRLVRLSSLGQHVRPLP